VIVLVLRYLAA